MRIKELRENFGIQQKELALELGIPSNTLSQYENGRREPGVEMLKKIAQYFHVSTDYLAGAVDSVYCPDCGLPYNPLDSIESEEHSQIHNRFLHLKESLGFLYSASNSNTKRVVSEGFLRDGGLPDDGQAFHVETLLQADYSDYARNRKYDVDISYNDFCADALSKGRYLDLVSDNAKKILFKTYNVKQNPIFTKRDERDIKKDLDSLMEKLSNKEYGPAAFDGDDIPEDDQALFAGQLELMLRRLKSINKEKYNPHKNKK